MHNDTDLNVPVVGVHLSTYIVAVFLVGAVQVLVSGSPFDFLHVEARLPSAEKEYVTGEPIKIPVEMSREEVIGYLEGIRGSNVTADLAFYAYRDMDKCSWEPFMKSAIERNPVSIEAAKEKSDDEVYKRLKDFTGESIYDGKRLAQPDEVINYGRGDGVEKAITLANILHDRKSADEIKILIEDRDVVVKAGEEYHFESGKGFEKELVVGD